MKNPNSFTDEKLTIGFKINLAAHIISHANCILSPIPIYTNFGIQTRYINKILEGMATIYARLFNQYKFEYHKLFSASFFKINEGDQRSDEHELFNNLTFNHKLTESDINNLDDESQLEYQIQLRETRDSGWILINSMKFRFLKTVELNGSMYKWFD